MAVVAALLFFASAVSANENKPIWLAVTRTGLEDAIRPLAEHRQKQGFDTIVSTKAIEAAISSAPRKPTWLLLVGDEEIGASDEDWRVPSSRHLLYRWRPVQRKQFASDAAWGDWDNDGKPDIAVGRIPARSADDASFVVNKIIKYESKAPSEDDLQLVAWGGAPGYGGAIDKMASTMLVTAFQATAPRWCASWLMSGDQQSPLCGWPADQPVLFNMQMQRGSALTVMLGHGTTDTFHSMHYRGLSVGYTASDAKRSLQEGSPTAPLFLFTCNSGNFTHTSPCLAESLLTLEGGPVATVAATTESHPLTNYYSSLSLLNELDGKQRLGELWLAAQNRSFLEKNPAVDFFLKDVEGKLEDEINIGNLKRDQLLMYAILGDPATRLRLPEEFEFDLKPELDGWRWTAPKLSGATTLSVSLRLPPGPLLPVTSDPSAEQRNALLESANQMSRFLPIATLDCNQDWSGRVMGPGTLRLVMSGPDFFRVATVELTAKK